MDIKELSPKQIKKIETIGLYLREIRMNENMTRDDVCLQTKNKISKHTLLRIERDCHNYGIKHLLLLAELYNTPPSEILSIID